MAPSTGVRFISLVSLAVLVVLVKDTDAFIFRLMQRLRGIDLNHTKIPENTEASMTSVGPFLRFHLRLHCIRPSEVKNT